MEHAFVPPAQQCCLPAGQVGRWHSRAATVLVVRQGRAWATVDGGPFARSPRGGDWFLDAGAELAVAPGRRLLVESAGREPVVVGIRPLNVSSPFAAAVASPLRWAGRLAGWVRA
ncbi:MAG: DUF2917 domain-containing protein [Pseudomonadota bacterium]